MSDEALRERVARLERSLRGWRIAMTAGVLVALLALGASVARTEVDHAASQEMVPTVIRAKRFELVDETGRARATLAIDGSRFATLRMTGEEGGDAVLMVSPDGRGFLSINGKLLWQSP